MELFKQTYFDWIYVNRNKDVNNRNKDVSKYIFFLCLLRVKKFSKNWIGSEEYEYYCQYLSFIKASGMIHYSETAKQEPYNTIIKNWHKPGISEDLQKKMYDEFITKAPYDKEYLESNLKFIWKLIFLVCLFVLFYSTIMICYLIGLKQELLCFSRLPYLVSWFFSLCYLVQSIQFFTATRNPKKHMNDWFYFYIRNRTCRKILHELYRKIARI